MFGRLEDSNTWEYKFKTFMGNEDERFKVMMKKIEERKVVELTDAWFYIALHGCRCTAFALVYLVLHLCA